jgi:uncharacterized membrane protein
MRLSSGYVTIMSIEQQYKWCLLIPAFFSLINLHWTYKHKKKKKEMKKKKKGNEKKKEQDWVVCILT